MGSRPPAVPPSFNRERNSGWGRPMIFLSDMAPHPSGGCSNLFPQRRKSGAATFDGREASPRHSRFGRNGRSEIKEDPQWGIFEIRERHRERHNQNDMCTSVM